MKWREVPHIQNARYSFAGLTELTAHGRTWACVGVGREVRDRMEKAMEEVVMGLTSHKS